jgi:hypothetical protein
VNEPLDNVTPGDVYCDRHHEILTVPQLLKNTDAEEKEVL